ncbi:MAG: tRNA (guanosine(37)-N1)-methyltransferase TrmD [Anaerolineae bacterium]|nr:tRNA (guanosine(37)-N1)-methyltransferase TrmD [Anaerolineae bacterium]
MWIDVLTLFPSMFMSPLQESILKRAQQCGHLTLLLHQIRDYTFDRHQMTDDLPYGGGRGMVMKPEPIFRAVHAISGTDASIPIVLLSPQGRTFTQQMAMTMAQQPRIIFICGHYEGVDERVRQCLVTDEISIGDYVLTGGELAAMVVIDAIARFIPGVLAPGAAFDDSYASGLLEGSQYTRPPVYAGIEVPAVLRSGHHAVIAHWKHQAALQKTYMRRPDLLENLDLDREDLAFIKELQQLQRNPGEPNEE